MMNEQKKRKMIRLIICVLLGGCAAQMLFLFSLETKIFIWTLVFLVVYVICYLLTGQIPFFRDAEKLS